MAIQQTPQPTRSNNNRAIRCSARPRSEQREILFWTVQYWTAIFINAVDNSDGETGMWNKDEIKGKGKQILGALKINAGALINDAKLQAQGAAERLAGKIQEKAGKTRRKTREALTAAGKALAGKP